MERQLDVQGVFQGLRVELSKVKAATENVGNYPQKSRNFPQNFRKTRKSQNDGANIFRFSGFGDAPTWQCCTVKWHETPETPEFFQENLQVVSFSNLNALHCTCALPRSFQVYYNYVLLLVQQSCTIFLEPSVDHALGFYSQFASDEK